ncbi:MAG: glycosyltransferase family 4 protein [Burkholderiaceae bacterium]|nr:glycosyltransferase family 4 protein [Burkholderiaceae bacterium]
MRLGIFLNHAIQIREGALLIERAEVTLIEELRSDGKNVLVFGIVDDGPELGGRLSLQGLSVRKLNLFPHRSALRILNYIWMLFLLPAWIGRCDHVYVFFPGHASRVAALWAVIGSVKYSFYVRGIWGGVSRKMTRIDEWLMKRSEFMIVTGKAFQRRLLQINPRVANEVPLLALYEKIKRRESRQQTSRPTRQMLFVGRLEASKGLHELLRATRLLVDWGFDEVQLRVVGSGAQRESDTLADIIDSLSLRSNVTLVGLVASGDQLAAEYENSDVFVFPSYYVEGFPRVYHEAMGFALPIVTCELPGTAGYLIHEHNCLYCQPRDPVDLAERIRWLIERPDHANRIGLQGFLDFKEEMNSFVHSSHGAQLLDLLRPERGRRE